MSRRKETINEAIAAISAFRQELNAVKVDRAKERLNAGFFSNVVDGLTGGMGTDTQSQPFTLAQATSFAAITLNRPLLSGVYQSQGLATSFIDQPVDDAFRGGIKFKSSQLDPDDLDLLNREFKRQRRRTRGSLGCSYGMGFNHAKSDLEATKLALKWTRLFGGGALIINTDQDFSRQLNIDAISEDSPLQFISADRWELVLQNACNDDADTPYTYYGNRVHPSRVVRMVGPEAPSLIRPRLQGWGMSIMERALRPLNIYLKFDKLLFELLDEAKTDVYKMAGFNTALASKNGSDAIQRRILLANQLKNYSSAITMDMLDDYQQKIINFSGFADIKETLRTDLCAYLEFPKNKLFGESAGGFGSGKDSLDNYNATVGKLREVAEPAVLEAGSLRSQQLFGVVPDDIEVEWTPLDVMDGTEQEQVKTSKQARTIVLFDRGLTSGQETSEILQTEGLLSIDTEVSQGLREPEPPMSQNSGEMEQQAELAAKSKTQEKKSA